MGGGMTLQGVQDVEGVQGVWGVQGAQGTQGTQGVACRACSVTPKSGMAGFRFSVELPKMSGGACGRSNATAMTRRC